MVALSPHDVCRVWIIGRSPGRAEHEGTDMTTTQSLRMEPWRAAIAPVSSELAHRIEGDIERRACGRIRDLHVVLSENQIILQGRTRTYHAKQLAQEAALDLASGDAVLTNQIVVC